MSKKKTIEVQGLKIRIEPIDADDYISLTDIAKERGDNVRAAVLIASWMKNNNTLLFLEQWEKIHNPNFKVHQMVDFRMKSQENRYFVTIQKYIQTTDAIGMVAKAGRYGGTYAHKDIALNFCYWLSPQFQVFLIKAFQKLMKEEYDRQNLKFHIKKITDHIDEARNWLDTIDGQEPDRNRLNKAKKKDE